MAFSDDVIDAAWDRSDGHCECRRTTHNHNGRCPRILIKSLRGRDVPGGWEAHHKTATILGDNDTLSNCEILCQLCHKATASYGG